MLYFFAALGSSMANSAVAAPVAPACTYTCVGTLNKIVFC